MSRTKRIKGDLTPTEVGKLLGMSPALVVKFFEEGRLAGYLVPGSRHRRIYPGSVLDFIKTMEGEFVQNLLKEVTQKLLETGYRPNRRA